MADYPDLPLDHESTRTPVDLTQINITPNGGYRGRNFQSQDLYRFQMSHSYVTKAEADSVYDQWSANRTAAVNLLWKKDSANYTVRYEGPPVVELIGGQWWKVTASLIGHKV